MYLALTWRYVRSWLLFMRVFVVFSMSTMLLFLLVLHMTLLEQCSFSTLITLPPSLVVSIIMSKDLTLCVYY